MRIELDYGRNGLEASIPDANLAAVLRMGITAPLSEPGRAIADALDQPISCLALRDLAHGKRSATIVICDVTRPVPNWVILPRVLDVLEAAGLDRDQITLLIATGTHRPTTDAELLEMVGEDALTRCTPLNHVCTDDDAMVALGTSPNGVPVRLNRAYVEAELRITVGLIEPHFMAGYSGGRKLVMPGVAALGTVQAWHSPRFLEHPMAANGVVEGNPVHEESLAITRMAPPHMVVDVTLDESNQITGVFAGDLFEAWRVGVRHAEKDTRVAIKSPSDIVVTTCAGYPLDATFYQAVKGMVGALPAVKPGGTIIIAAECSEGVGSEIFRQTLLNTTDLEEFTANIQHPDWEFVPDQWEVEELARAVRHCEVHCVCSGIEPDELGRLFVTPAESVEAGIEAGLKKHGPHATVTVIPRGPYVIPYLA